MVQTQVVIAEKVKWIALLKNQILLLLPKPKSDLGQTSKTKTWSFACMYQRPTAAVILVFIMGCPDIKRLGDYSTFNIPTVA